MQPEDLVVHTDGSNMKKCAGERLKIFISCDLHNMWVPEHHGVIEKRMASTRHKASLSTIIRRTHSDKHENTRRN